MVTFAPGILPDNAREPYFEAVGVVVTLMLVGQLLEARARKGTGEAMRALAGLQPKTARVVRDGKETSIAIDDVRVATSSPSVPASSCRSTASSYPAAPPWMSR